MKRIIYLSLVILFFGSCDPCIETGKKLTKCDSLLVLLKDSIESLPKVDSLYCQESLDSLEQLSDSLQFIYDYLSVSWDNLVDMFDSVNNIPPDTILFIPQCTLCYKTTDTINGIVYYVGYNGSYYRLFEESDTLIKQIFYKDTNVVRYILHDSIFKFPQMSLIIVEASGTICDGEYPNLNVLVNGILVKSFRARSPMYNQYSFVAEFHEYDIDSIEVEFDNDCWLPEIPEDRNASVRRVMVNHHDYLLKENTTLYQWNKWDTIEANTVDMRTNGHFTIRL